MSRFIHGPRRFLALALGLIVAASLTGAAYIAAQPGQRMTDAAERFLDTLDDQQRQTATMAFDNEQRLAWHFIPKERKGLPIKNMNDDQRRAALSLLRSALSEVGYHKARTIMDLEHILRALGGDPDRRHPGRFHFTVFGEPASDDRWGLSVEGHHLSLNFVVDGNEVVSHTPAFFGANPAVITEDMDASATAGPPAGTRVLEQEEALAFELLGMLDEDQRDTAILSDEAQGEVRTPGEPQPAEAEPDGLPASEMTGRQRRNLFGLIYVYTQNMPRELAQQRLRQIGEAGIDNIHFAWTGATEPGQGHHYRIQGPTFVIELVNTQPDAAGNPASHIHSVWRDLDGDFGIDR